jgi:hypothetical protein
MKKHLFKILPLVLLIAGCKKTDINSAYPTTYELIASTPLAQLRTAFASKNRYMVSSVNEYGFCDYLDDLLTVESPPILNPLTRSEAIEVVKSFVSKNRAETGIINQDDLGFYSIPSGSQYGGATGWHLKSFTQRYDTIEVINTVIIFHITNREVTGCVGNWFPEIYIPEKFNISQTSARASLLDKTVTHYSIAGTPNYVTISNADISKSTVRIKILPVKKDNIIRLTVNWLIELPAPVYYKIYVDVMTGEINGEEPTIIS